MVDVIQGGAGTSTNMNANEVIANRASSCSARKGDWGLQGASPERACEYGPVDQRRLSDGAEARDLVGIFRLVDAMAYLRKACEAQGRRIRRRAEDGPHPAAGRRADDPGQEFSTYAVMLGEDEERLKEAALLIREMNLGATAIGTGINAHPEYARPRLPQTGRNQRHPGVTAPT